MSYFGQYNERFTIIDENEAFLSSPDNEVSIPEPRKFDEQEFKLERDKTWRSFNAEYSEETIGLEFAKNKEIGGLYSAYDIISNVLDEDGFDATILFRSYRTPKNGTEQYKEWKVIGFEELDYCYVCRLKRVRFDDKLRTRLDVDIDVESTEDLDGNTSTALELETIPFHSRALMSQFRMETQSTFLMYLNNDVDLGNNEVPMLSAGTASFEYESWWNIIYDKIGGRNYIIDHVASPDSNTDDLDYMFQIPLSDQTHIIEFDVLMKIGSVYGGSADDPVDVVLNIEINGNLMSSTGTSNQTTGYPFNPLFQQYEYVYDIDINESFRVSPTDGVVNVRVYFSGEGTFEFGRVMNLTKSYFDVKLYSYESCNLVDGAFIYDLVNKLTQKAIGDESYNPLRSTLLEKTEDGAASDGLGALNFMTIGSKIRGYDENLITSLGDILEFIRVRYNAGFVTYNDSGNDYLIVEQADHFFQDVEIIDIGDGYEDLTISINDDLAYNEIELGYNNFAEENEDGSIDGFNTTRNYTLPVTYTDSKLNITTNVITDGAEIERVRKSGIANDESDGSDEKVFAVKCVRFNDLSPVDPSKYSLDYAHSAFYTGTNKITLLGYIFNTLSSGDKIVHSTEGTFTIDELNYNYDGANIFTDIYTIETISTASVFNTGTYYFTDSDDNVIDVILPERLESFVQLSDIYDQDSIYNLHHAPSNILLQWFNYLGGMLNEKPISDKFYLSSSENNTGPKFGGRDLTSNSISESSDYTLFLLRSYNPTYLNYKKYTVTCFLDYDSELKPLFDSMTGENGVTDFGYVSLTDYKGNKVSFYPTDINYNPVTTETTIVGWGKKL